MKHKVQNTAEHGVKTTKIEPCAQLFPVLPASQRQRPEWRWHRWPSAQLHGRLQAGP